MAALGGGYNHIMSTYRSVSVSLGAEDQIAASVVRSFVIRAQLSGYHVVVRSSKAIYCGICRIIHIEQAWNSGEDEGQEGIERLIRAEF